jgi:beta-ribofuranosylaminobenzene 5'-phosphate synthase
VAQSPGSRFRQAPQHFVQRLANTAKLRNLPINSAARKRANSIPQRGAQLKGVQVTTAARLHLGFLDLNGDLGRWFGSIGLAIDGFETSVQLREASSFEAAGEERERAARLALRIAETLGLKTTVKLVIPNAIPAHAGLGSGTQLALAVATAFRRFGGLPLDVRHDARLLDRGARSGVGAALFERGGLAIDAGKGPDTEIPPVVARLTFPQDWRVLLILDRRAEGVHGEAERRAFAGLPRFPADSASEICRRTLMQILPGAVERNLAAFGDGVARIQEIIGDHFAPAQGGGRFSSVGVGRVAARLSAHGACGIGQSSWGPTGFAFASDADHARYLTRRASVECEPGVEIKTCCARDHGAEIREDEDVSIQ